MLAYLEIDNNPAEGAALRDRIDAIVDNYYAAAPLSTTSRQKRKKNAFPQRPQEEDGTPKHERSYSQTHYRQTVTKPTLLALVPKPAVVAVSPS